MRVVYSVRTKRFQARETVYYSMWSFRESAEFKTKSAGALSGLMEDFYITFIISSQDETLREGKQRQAEKCKSKEDSLLFARENARHFAGNLAK